MARRSIDTADLNSDSAASATFYYLAASSANRSAAGKNYGGRAFASCRRFAETLEQIARRHAEDFKRG